jgi:hypothetical protein
MNSPAASSHASRFSCPKCGAANIGVQASCLLCGAPLAAPVGSPTGPPPGPSASTPAARASSLPTGPPPGPFPSTPPVPAAGPPAGPPPSSAIREAPQPRPILKRRGVQALILLLVLGVGVLGGLYLTGRLGGSEVLLEAKAAPGPDPFAPPAPLAPAVNSTPPASPSPAVSQPVPNPAQPANSLAIYGGSGSDQVCDKTRLVAFLETNPPQAEAWAGVEGIKVADIPSFIGSLTPAVLRRDTRVTNHGFVGGKASQRQSALQAGTAVLTDASGVPVARCLCGNPLLPAKAVSGTPRFGGTPWSGFQAAQVVAMVQTPLALQKTALPALSATQKGPSAGNLVTDGGFEDGLVAPWGTGIYEPRAEAFWGAASATAAIVTSDVHSGNRALMITNSSARGPNVYRTLSQQLVGTPGAGYCLSFWAKAKAAHAAGLSFPLDHAWLRRVSVPAGTSGWTQFAGSATAEGTGYDVRVISEDMGSALVDDIELTFGACTVPNGTVPAGVNPRGR